MAVFSSEIAHFLLPSLVVNRLRAGIDHAFYQIPRPYINKQFTWKNSTCVFRVIMNRSQVIEGSLTVQPGCIQIHITHMGVEGALGREIFAWIVRQLRLISLPTKWN